MIPQGWQHIQNLVVSVHLPYGSDSEVTVGTYGGSKRRVKKRGPSLTLLSVSTHEGRGMHDVLVGLVSGPPPIRAGHPDYRHNEKRRPRDSDREEGGRRDTLIWLRRVSGDE